MESKNQHPETQKILQELSAKSWNLELIISGAAVFFTLELPVLFDRLWQYYTQEIQPSEAKQYIILPMLAYSFFITVSRILTFSFTIHFILRAFWVSLVGLYAVYPKGIRFDNIPNVPSSLSSFFEKKLGNFEPRIFKVDRLANQLFAFAFLVTLMGLSIGVVYLFLFYIIWLIEQHLGFKGFDLLSKMFVYLFGTLIICSFLVKRVPYFKQKYELYLKEKFERSAALLGWKIGTFFMPFLHHSINFISYTFASNLERKQYYRNLTFTMVLVLSSVFWVFFAKLEENLDRNLIFLRTMFGSGTASTELFERKYDNLRAPNVAVPPVSLPSEIIETDYLKIFINFPNWLDRQSATWCPELHHDKEVSKREKRRLNDRHLLDCLSRYFSITLNDSLIATPDFVFYEKNGNRGLLLVLPSQDFVPQGKNSISVKIPSSERPDSLAEYGGVFFWYYPK